MRFNKVQVAWFGNKSAMEAVDRASGEVFAQIGRPPTATPATGRTSSCTRTARIQKLDDVLKCDKSLDFGIGDPNSTSGFLVPTTFIFSARNIDPKACFKTVRKANHEANALAVANKQVHVATNNSENLERLKKTAAREGGADPRHLDLAADPVRSAGLAQGSRRRAQEEVLRLAVQLRQDGTPEKAKLAALQWAPFKKSDNNQLLPIRQLEVNKAIMKLKGDEKVAEAEKTTKLAELQQGVRSSSASRSRL